MSKDLKLAIVVSDSAQAQAGAAALRAEHEWVEPWEADALVVLGGDGFMLHVLHRMLDVNRIVPCYGLNLGTLGFLMNRKSGKNSRRLIGERVARARQLVVRPLEMVATQQDGQEFCYHAVNEISLLRETRQTAKIEVIVNGKTRIPELSGDGVIVATAAGSTAYNLSADGPILPLGSNLLALTPISPFRPRRWRGAILPDRYDVEFRVREPLKRPVSAVADHMEVRDVKDVRIKVARNKDLKLLFDANSTLEDRIFAEQFQV